MPVVTVKANQKTPTGVRALVTILTACDIAGVSRRTIYYWLQHNKLEYVRTASGSIRIFADSLFRTDRARPVAAPRATTQVKPTDAIEWPASAASPTAKDPNAAH